MSWQKSAEISKIITACKELTLYTKVHGRTSINKIMHCELFWLENHLQIYTVFRRFT